MIKEVIVPSPGESIDVVEIAEWLVKDGDIVSMDDCLGTIDSDKATLEIIAEATGKIKIFAQLGEVEVNSLLYTVDTSFQTDDIDMGPTNLGPIEVHDFDDTIIMPTGAIHDPTDLYRDQKLFTFFARPVVLGEVYYIKNGKIKRDWLKTESELYFSDFKEAGQLFESNILARKHINELVSSYGR